MERKAMEGVMDRTNETYEQEKEITRPRGGKRNKKEFDREGYEKKVLEVRKGSVKPVQRKEIPKRPTPWLSYKANAHKNATLGFWKKYEFEHTVPDILQKKMDLGRKWIKEWW
jgi:hypothetical protein